MNKMDYRKKIFQLVVLCIIWIFSDGSAQAASLKFDPTTISATNGKTFEVKINVELGSEQATSVDAFITYDSTMFDLGTTPITAGTFFPSTANVTNQPGKVYIAGLVSEGGQYRTDTGTLATITFKPKNTGASSMTFDCTPGVTASDSNIIKNDTNSSDIINCAENNTLKVDVSGASSTPTPTPYGYNGGTPTPTPYGYKGGTPTPTPATLSKTAYDANGNPIKMYDSNGNTISSLSTSGKPVQAYDINGNPIKIYDTNGNPITTGGNLNTLPETGTFENVMKYSLPGGIMLLVGGLLLLL